MASSTAQSSSTPADMRSGRPVQPVSYETFAPRSTSQVTRLVSNEGAGDVQPPPIIDLAVVLLDRSPIALLLLVLNYVAKNASFSPAVSYRSLDGGSYRESCYFN